MIFILYYFFPELPAQFWAAFRQFLVAVLTICFQIRSVGLGQGAPEA